jgi:hypothetical protein
MKNSRIDYSAETCARVMHDQTGVLQITTQVRVNTWLCVAQRDALDAATRSSDARIDSRALRSLTIGNDARAARGCVENDASPRNRRWSRSRGTRLAMRTSFDMKRSETKTKEPRRAARTALP